jgi:hypothetical protein
MMGMIQNMEEFKPQVRVPLFQGISHSCVTSRMDSAANILAHQVAGDTIAPSDASDAAFVFDSHLLYIREFLESHVHNIKSLQDSIVPTPAIPTAEAVSTRNGSTVERSEPASPLPVPETQNLPPSGSESNIAIFLAKPHS